MSEQKPNSGAPRSRSRSKRSSTNLANLRLAPLSAKYTAPNGPSSGAADGHDNAPKTPSDEAFARNHSSYIQGKSAPTTPGILSRSSARRSFSGGLSRRDESMYNDNPEDEDDDSYQYTRNLAAVRAAAKREGDIAHAKSDAALFTSTHGSVTPGPHGHRRHLSGHQTPSSKRYRLQARSKTGTSTPRALDPDDNWLSRTGSRTSALLQEGKGQSWLAARDPPPVSSDDENEDDNYEEMAALSASTAKLERFAQGESHSPRASRWGSRYGSRSASARTSRYGSPVGTRTPRPHREASGYFDDHQNGYSAAMLEMQERAFKEHPYPPEFSEDQAEVDRISGNNSFGLGSVVDRLMNFRVFGAPADGGETTDDEAGRDGADDTETEDEAKDRMAREMQRRKIEKEKLVALPPAPVEGKGEAQVGGWQDAAWLLSVATKAMF